jgi:HEAT repeat protein
LRDLLNRQDVELQLNLALAIANADPTDRASVNQLATLAQSTASDVAIYALAYLREIADSRVVSCFDKLRPLIVEPKFAAGDAPLNDGEVITEFTILLRKCKKALAPTLSRWLTEPEPVPGFHASVLANFPSPGFLGREVEPDEQLVRSITRHFRSENLAQRDAAITALGVLVDHHNIEGISVPGEHFTLAIQNGNDSLRAIALNALALVTVETPEAIRSSVKDATEAKSLDVRIAAARALACLFAADLNVVLPIAREAINSDRPAAVGLIQELGENAGPLLPALMEAIERGHTDDWIEASERWANAFSELSSTDAIEPLVDGLSHKNPDVRRTCATALGHFADSWEAIDALANRIHDVDGGSWPVGEAAIESLIRSNRKLDHIAPRLITLIKSVTREEQPGLYDAAIRLLARIGPPANKALPTLATYDYVTRVRNSDGQWCTHVSKASFETAVATKSIAPTSRLGLVGFRQIIKSVAGGRAWMPLTDRVEDGTLENSRHIGFTLSIDYIVKNDLRELVDELKLPLKTSLLHSDYRAELLFALAMLEPQGDWKIQLKSLAKDGSARAKQRLDHM